jgi:hypothetical protein
MSHGRDTSPKAYGFVAAFETPEQLVAAAKKATAAGYRDMDAYSPIPVEGITEALEWKDDRLGWLVFFGGLSGIGAGLLLEWWTSTIAYPHNVGGKPLFSLPAFLPVFYECTILFAAFAATFGMLALNGLPKPHHPIFNSEAGQRASQDRFVLCIEATDPQFEREKVRAFMEGLGATSVEYVETSEGY